MIRLTTGCRRLDAIYCPVSILLIASCAVLNGQQLLSGQELQRPMISVVEPAEKSTAVWTHEVNQAAGKKPAVMVAFKPPQPILEQPTQAKPAGSNLQWIEGYWAWDKAREEFVWVNGLWRDRPANQSWVDGFWKQHGQVYRWNPGFWTIREFASIHDYDAVKGVNPVSEQVVVSQIVVPGIPSTIAQRERRLLVRQQSLRDELANLERQRLELELNALMTEDERQKYERELDLAISAALLARQHLLYDSLVREKTRIQRQREFQARLEKEQRENQRLDLEARIRQATIERTTDTQRLVDQQQIQRNREEFRRQQERRERRADGNFNNNLEDRQRQRELARFNRDVQQARADRALAQQENLTTEQTRLRNQQLEIQRNREEFARQKERDARNRIK